MLLDRLVSELGGVPSRDFFPVRPSDGAHDPLAPLLELGRSADELAETAGLAGPAGSLGFVVPGARSVSGKPLLANDAHVDFSAPACLPGASRAGRFELRRDLAGLPSLLGTNRHRVGPGGAARVGVDCSRRSIQPSRAATARGRWQGEKLRSAEIAVRDAAPVRLSTDRARPAPARRTPRRLARERAALR